LTLSGATGKISCTAVGLDLTGVAFEGAPAVDLYGVQFGNAATEPVATIPLKPATLVRITGGIL
jgi:hypothetical protein